MPGLHLHKSNRLETLADALAEITAVPLRAVFAPETVVVQSLGMRRWLAQALAARRGVSMNASFPFPAAFAQSVFAAMLPDTPPDAGFSRDVLPWRILGALPALLPRAEFAELRQYCAGENGALKSFQIASRIAAAFDRYLAYRPQLLLDWEVGRETHWQAHLWRALTRGRAPAHPPALAQALAERGFPTRAASGNPCRSTPAEGNGGTEFRQPRGAETRAPSLLPERISVFGISSLPPIYIGLLGAVAQLAEVHLFLLEPTADYWADLVSPRERDRLEKIRALPEDQALELTGNPLLASLCKTGRDFSWLLLDQLDPHSERELFTPPPEVTLLGQLQADIFHLRAPDQRRAISADDRSVQVHCCHGPMRELEILHDHLLDLFARTPGLAPREVLVAMPDVETYAPFIDAVFGAPESEAQRIPYSIADRAARNESSLADAFLRVLDLAGSRFAAPEVLALLDTPAVRARFALEESALPLIREWVARTGIRWGIDAEHRASFDLPPFAQNSWRAGLERLLLGYALPGDDGTLFAGILPDRGIEGATAATLGGFVEFAEQLFAHTAALAAPRPLRAWEKTLRALLTALFSADDDFADETRRVLAALETLGTAADAADFELPVEFAAIRAHLATALADTDSGHGFLAGRVTFCGMKPMRSIPFRVLCLIGLDDTAFPRRDRAPAFDLIAQKPRRGDRSLRDDDRYLFLEALLSARDTLYLSYAGLSVKDNTESPPSVLVSELLDYLARHFILPADFVVKHKLQAFSAAYFTGENPRLFSYSADNAAAALRRRATRAEAPPFAARSLPAPGPEWRAVTLDQLTEFFCHPAKFFLRERLRLRLPEGDAPLPDTEPAALDGLTKYGFREDLTRRSVTRGSHAADAALARATGALPCGYAGDSAYGEIAAECAELFARLDPVLTAPPLAPLSFEVESDGWHLTGALTDVRPAALIRWRAGQLRPADRLRAWLAHLALQLAAPADHPRITIFHTTDTTLTLTPVAEPRVILTDLLALYAHGLTTPLRFLPDCSWEFARRTLRPSKSEKTPPLAATLATWTGGDFKRGLCDDPCFALAFRGELHPLDEAFAATSLRIFTPLLDATVENA